MNSDVSDTPFDILRKPDSAFNKILFRTKYFNKLIKKGIWFYLLLLIFEGSLRKWFLPGLSDAILIIRDPVAIWLLITASNAGIKYSNGYVKFIGGITFFSILSAMIWGHGNILIALYGARITLLHFPLIYLIGKVFTREDVIQVGKFILWLTIPMTILIAAQFYSPQSAFVNRGIGGNLEGAGFTGSGDYFRPPGTFSFTSGNSNYYSFAAPFIFFFLFHDKSIKKIIIYVSLFALILAIPLSISRALFFSVFITTIFVIMSLRSDSKKAGQILGSFIGLYVLVLILGSLDIFKTSLGAFTDRFDSANEVEGGVKGVLLDRFLGGLVNAISSTGEAGNTFFGAGIGYGTNVGSRFASGQIQFLVAEQEWGREIGELGAILGLLIIFIRVAVSFTIFNDCYQKLKRKDALPWILLSFSFLTLLQGGWAQPTSLGFFVIAGGLTIASLNDGDFKNAK